MLALVIGAGKLGCGYLCPLLLDAGWEVTLVAPTETIAGRIREAGSYQVRVTGREARRVEGFDVVAARTRQFDEAVANADLAVTAVGVSKVAALGRELATALAIRDLRSPLQFLVAENHDSAPVLERAVRNAAAELELQLPPATFAGAIAEVTVARGDWDAERPRFVRDRASRLRIDGTRLLKPLPRIPGIVVTSNYQAMLQEKLFFFSAGHALCAYLGTLRGHRFVDEAVNDSMLRPVIAGCLLESKSALLSLHPMLGNDVRSSVAQVLRRYANAELRDPVSRVAREPIRKLGPGDRLLGPANLIRIVSGRVPAHFALGIAGALLYRDPHDEQARQLSEMLSREGLVFALREICGLPRHDVLSKAVEHRYRNFILTEASALFPPVHEAAETLLAGAEATGP